MSSENQQHAGDDEAAERRVADPEDFNQTERLRAINAARQEAGETIQVTMTQLRTDREFDSADRQQILRAAVMRYLTNIEWLVHEAEDSRLLSELNLGTVTVEPPQYLRELANSQSDGYPRVVGSPDLPAKKWEINGINDYLTAPEAFTGQWTVTLDTRHKGPKQVTETEATYMPAHVSFNAFRMANRFLSKQGIDVDLAEEQHRATVDEDVLEEVEQWRKQNVQ